MKLIGYTLICLMLHFYILGALYTKYFIHRNVDERGLPKRGGGEALIPRIGVWLITKPLPTQKNANIHS
jgi:hypothetical protein